MDDSRYSSDIECGGVIINGIYNTKPNEEGDRLIGNSWTFPTPQCAASTDLLDEIDGFRKRMCQYWSNPEVRYSRPPVFIAAVVITMILLHYVLGDEQRRELEWRPGPQWHQPWRLVGYGFVHGDHAHLWYNVAPAILFGWLVECEQGWWRVGAVWALGLLSGSLSAGVFQPESIVVGASAAVFAIAASLIPATYLYDRIPLAWKILRAACVVFSIAGGLFMSFTNQQMAWSSHLFGAIVGLLAGFMAYSGAISEERKAFERIGRWASSCLLLTMLLGAVFFYVFASNNTQI